MRKHFALLCALLLLLSPLCGCAHISEETVRYASRETSVPATITLPGGEGPFPLVVLAHGFNGERNQGGGFSAIAQALAKKGIASIRMDFPGCGESAEDSAENCLSAMKADVLAAIAFAVSEYPIDAARVGILGYSLGGRLALEMLSESLYPFSAAALLAPAADTEDLKGILGGAEGWARYEQIALTAESGYAVLLLNATTALHLSAAWFSDLAAYPGASSAEAAAAAYTGSALVLYAPEDNVIAASVSQYTADCLRAKVVQTPGGGHGFGFYGDAPRILRRVCREVSGFFAEALA